MSEGGDQKKLSDLRVVDLRAELERRGLETKGVKKDLVDRLQKALQDEGEDPERYIFDFGGDKKSGKRLSTSSNQDDSAASDKQEGDLDDKVPSNADDEDVNTNQAEEDTETIEIIEDPPVEATNKVAVEIDEKASESTQTTKDSTMERTEAQTTQDADNKKTPAVNAEGSNSAPAEESSQKKPSNPRLLWITNVPKNTRANELKHLLSPCGKVVCAKVVVNARFPGSCCFGYVTMGTADDATNVISKLNNTEFNGQIIKIDRFENVKPDTLNPARKNKTVEEPKKPEKKDESVKIKKDGTAGSSDAGKSSDETKDRKSNASTGKNSPERTKSRTSDRSSRDRRRTPSKEKERSDSRGAHRSNVLTFDKIKEERERQRIRERERIMREETRRRQEEALRIREMREITRRQRNEAERLEREREKLRLERDRIEREKTELLKLERERQKIEREKLEMEKMELQRSRQRLEEDRRAVKRPLSTAPYRRDEPFEDRKRSGGGDRHFDEPTSRPPRFEPPPNEPNPAKKFAPSKDFKRIPFEKHDVFSEKRGREYDSERPHQSTSLNRPNPTMKYDRFDTTRESNVSLRHTKDTRYVERSRSPLYRPNSDRERHLSSQKSERDHYSNAEPHRFDRTNSWGHPGQPSKSFNSSTPKPWTKSTWRPEQPSNERWVSSTGTSGRSSLNQGFPGNSSMTPACPPPPGISYSDRFDYNKSSNIRKY